VRLVGGGARNPLWTRILASALAAPVIPLAEPESAALGAAIQAQWTARRAAGEDVSADAVAAPLVRPGDPVEPDREAVAISAEARSRVTDATARLFGAPAS